ncbi:MAG: YggS family pyridoxal phosphate-dependent enzyme [Opitutales bacterium]|nr:YggS family pyridoxal phosphate-dependent enzyme [Opitutales bacterium]
MIDPEGFRRRFEETRSRIVEAAARAGRDAGEITLMAVTKTHGPEAVDAAAAADLRHIGENRVQEAAKKQSGVKAEVYWELIGPLQSNKARLAAAHFDRVQTVDRAKIVRALDRACGELGRPVLPVLVQVNVSEDPRKAGVSVRDAPALAEAVSAAEHLRLEGLMTIPALDDDAEVARRAFAGLRDLRDRLAERLGMPLPVLSMGMTGDLETAVEEGSTLLRVGTALFGERGSGFDTCVG